MAPETGLKKCPELESLNVLPSITVSWWFRCLIYEKLERVRRYYIQSQLWLRTTSGSMNDFCVGS